MDFQTLASSGVQWLWEEYGKIITSKAFGSVRDKWKRFHWQDAESKYRHRMAELYSTIRILGNPKLIVINSIFTNVYLLDRPTASLRYDLNELQSIPLDRDEVHFELERQPALDILVKHKRLYVLGKPGSGKTTFLKFITLQACSGKLIETPIFVSLREWADSKLDLLDYISEQFAICQFPDAEAFILQLLKKGKAILLLDGLDEVSQGGNQRSKTITTIINLVKKYPDVQVCLTCRNAATEYSFELFEYVEIADFYDTQVFEFVTKWYQNDQLKLDRFVNEMEKPENQGLRELARTPLLLALLCLSFDETGYFPSRRVDLYKESLEALLKKWDASRGVYRDEIYRRLSIVRKEQLLAVIAAKNFEANRYYIRGDSLSDEINHFLDQLPPTDIFEDRPDGLTILKAIESQHGIISEQAHDIYSFTHLTFQEFYTAKYIVENSSSGAIDRLIRSHLTDDRWSEVFYLTSSMFYEADFFFQSFLVAIEDLIKGSNNFVKLLRWVSRKAEVSKWPGPSTRSIILLSVIGYIYKYFGNRFEYYKDLHQSHLLIQQLTDQFISDDTVMSLGQKPVFPAGRIMHFNYLLNNPYDFQLLRELGVKISESDLQKKLELISSLLNLLNLYLKANLLLIGCMQVAALTDRNKVGSRLLMPPINI